MMLQCVDDEDTGLSVLHFFRTETCWKGIIIINQIIAIFAIVLMVLFQLVMQLLCFDAIYEEKKTNSKRNGRCVLLYWMHVTVVILLTSLLPDTSNTRIICIFYQIFGGVGSFLFMKNNDTFNQRFI